MSVHHGIVDAIGNTPMIRLQRASELTGCTILGKAEFMNPGQSVKDRAALFIIKDAEARGLLRPGGVIVGVRGSNPFGRAIYLMKSNDLAATRCKAVVRHAVS